MANRFEQGCDVVTLTRALVQQGAMAGEEAPVAEVVRAAMQALGYDEIVTDDLGNVTGLVGPRGAPVKLLFDGHMDVVPASGSWSRDPFSGDVEGGQIHGRGTTDMKGPLAAAICGVAEAARTEDLSHRVAVSASVMEEVIEGAALSPVLDTHCPEAVVICEPSDLELKIAQRGCVEVLVHVAGIPAHAAFPERGVNAIELAARATLALAALEMPSDPVLGKMVLVPTDIISAPYPSISALPSKVSLRYDRRTGVGETAETVMQQIRAALAPIAPEAFTVEVSARDYQSYTGITFRVPRDLPAWHTPETHPLVRAVQSCLTDLGLSPLPGRYEFCTNGSEAAGRRGLPTIGFGPGRPSDAHIIDESISVAALEQAVAVYRALALRIGAVDIARMG
ncbi:MAG: YgeY family selenium metabolism-linked hydrolase [Pseudodonghicola sp.]|nr:YgeY family selenium metabolism-linked hydrolase [Pseudodonghicola sp.]